MLHGNKVPSGLTLILVLSSQDTVVALQALSTSAALLGSDGFDLTVRVNADASTAVASFHIHQDNYMLYQSQQVRRDHATVRQGSGFLLGIDDHLQPRDLRASWQTVF